MNGQKQNAEQSGQGTLPCIWMMAGVLSYKLCDREYNCDQCELHRVLKSGATYSLPSEQVAPLFSSPEEQSEAGGIVEEHVNNWLSQIIAGSKIYLDRCYSPSHFWMYPEEENVVVGIDTNMLKILHPISEMIPPEPHHQFKRHQYCGLIVRDDLTIPLHAPFSGEVVAVNESYVSHLQQEYPSDDHWIFKMHPAEKVQTIDDICQGEDMLRWYVRKIHLIKGYLREMLSRTAIGELGVTMADGGETELNLEHILGKKAYKNLVKEIFALR
ncbi:MAG TPA: hypothetical protein VKA68_00510 [bacterium]|nr:hypothetical protein [bacterium]